MRQRQGVWLDAAGCNTAAGPDVRSSTAFKWQADRLEITRPTSISKAQIQEEESHCNSLISKTLRVHFTFPTLPNLTLHL